jgi:hypothetical protein
VVIAIVAGINNNPGKRKNPDKSHILMVKNPPHEQSNAVKKNSDEERPGKDHADEEAQF